jgi:glutaminyl-tRNA synthetase
VDVIKDETSGEIKEVHCTYDPETRGGWSTDGRKVKGTSHWVSIPHCIEAEVRIYDRLFNKSNPAEKKDAEINSLINPDSLKILKGCKLEPSLASVQPGERYQFLRQGYYCVDSVDSRPGNLVFNRAVSLKDTWAKIEKSLKQS